MNKLPVARRLASVAFKAVIVPQASYAKQYRFPIALEHATGKSLVEKLCINAGVDDPWDHDDIDSSRPSSEEDPYVVRSYYNARIVTCFCDDVPGPYYMMVTKGRIHRCKCGHFFTCKDRVHPLDTALKILREKVGEEEFLKLQEEYKPVDSWVEYYHKLGLMDKDQPSK